MKKRILFLGEGPLDGPARYLAGILKWANFAYDHCGDQEPIFAEWFQRHYDAFVLSDYRHSSFTKAAERWLVDRVRTGAGLLMIGGWASFTGLVGRYKGSAIESLLPVRCIEGDDRVNWISVAANPLFRGPGKILKGLDWENAPVVCGFHRIEVKRKARVILSLRDLHLKLGKPALGRAHPLLVVGKAERGRTAAFLSDCAPHWAGGLVDWGKERVPVRLQPKISIEVGDQYLKFFARLLRWISTNQPKI